MLKTNKHIAAIDLGGTKVLCALLDHSCKVIHRVKKSSPSGATAQSIVAVLKDMVHLAHKEAGVPMSNCIGLAVAVPGIVDPGTGIVRNTPNLGFVNFPLRQTLRTLFRFPILLENDVNAGTWGEYCFGPVHVHRNVLGVFPGTGIGGALIIEKKLYRGSSGGAGEIGHMIIQADGRRCGCGQQGCVEALSSRGALSRDAVFFASSGAAPTVLADAGTDYRSVRSKVLFKAYKAGDPAIVALVNTSIRHLGIAVANSVNLFNPDAIVVGGGLVEKFGAFYVRELRNAVLSYAMSPLGAAVKFYPASLKDDAVVRGAAQLLLASARTTR